MNRTELYFSRLDSYLASLRGRLPDPWWAWVLGGLVLVQQLVIYAPYSLVHRFAPDPATFMLGGELLSRGYSPYLYMFDVKPPAVYLTTALTSLATGGPIQHYFVASLLTSLFAALTVLTAAGIVYHRTRSNAAAVAVGLSIFAYTRFLTLPVWGIYAKYYALAFGFLGIYAVLTDRPTLGVALSTLAAGYWQFALVFPVIAGVEVYRRGASLGKPFVAGAGVVAVVVAPIVLLGGGRAMVEQVVLHSLSMSDQSGGIVARIYKFRDIVPFAWPLYYGGLLATIYCLVRYRREWWVGAGLAWSLLQLGALDFDSYPDGFLLVVWISVGLGLFVGRLSRDQQLALLFAILSFTAGQMYPNRWQYLSDRPGEPNLDNPQIRAFVNEEYPPETCLVTFGGIDGERRLRGVGLPATCEGRFPPG